MFDSTSGEQMTNHGRTQVVDGVEYNAYPPPVEVVRLTKRSWAEQMAATGTLRFGSLAWYRAWENEVLGDPQEGEGVLSMKGYPYTTGSANPLFAWCASLPSISPERAHLMAQHGEYDCCVHISDFPEFIRRIKPVLVGKRLWLHCGAVAYTRGDEVSVDVLRSQSFHFNVFQKDRAFADDREYRLALTDLNMGRAEAEHVILEVGPCLDILEVVALSPSMRLVGEA
jgi:hypothetical protein